MKKKIKMNGSKLKLMRFYFGFSVRNDMAHIDTFFIPRHLDTKMILLPLFPQSNLKFTSEIGS